MLDGQSGVGRIGRSVALAVCLWAGPGHASDHAPHTAPLAHAPQTGTTARHAGDTGAAERVLAAGRVRTLATEIYAAACHLSTGLDAHSTTGAVPGRDTRAMPGAAHTSLRSARNEMRSLLNALEFGAPRLSIPSGEHRSSTVRDLHALRVIWAPLKTHVNALLEDPDAAREHAAMEAYAGVMAEYSEVLFAAIAGQYANPFELLQIDAVRLDLATRHARDTLQLAALACAVGAGDAPDEAVSDLLALRARVVRTGLALRDGLPSMGVPPAPTPRIAAHLDAARATILAADPALERIATGVATQDDRALVAEALTGAAREIGLAAQLFAVQSKRMY